MLMKRLTSKKIDEILNNLYSTDFFENIEIEIKNNNLILTYRISYYQSINLFW